VELYQKYGQPNKAWQAESHAIIKSGKPDITRGPNVGYTFMEQMDVLDQEMTEDETFVIESHKAVVSDQ